MASGKSKIYIYDRKEIAILVLLGVMVALFAFTLGIHLGKTVKHASAPGLPSDPATAPVTSDRIPERTEFADQERKVKDTVDEALYEELHTEVGKTGVKLTPGRQVDLPDETVAEKPAAPARPAEHAPVAAEKTAPATADKSAPTSEKLDDLLPALNRPTPAGNFTIQVGSFPTLGEAKTRADALDAVGLKPFVRFVDLHDKGKWYRVYLGGYEGMDAAQKAGQRHKQTRVIDSFLVAKMPE